MRKNFPPLIIALLFFVGCKASDEINLTTLLNEMVDRDQITYFPETNYQCLQASSYNRESISPDQPGWFADSDGIGYIRIEENNGQKEWVIMEDDGPGVITKIWAVCFYYGLNDTTGANIKIYLDGAQEPVINTNFFALVKGQDFVKPPFADESTRAGNLYFPIPYGKSCKITMDKKAFYNIINYRSYPEGTKVRTFTMEEFNSIKKVRKNIAQQLLSGTSKKGNEQEEVAELTKDEELSVDLPHGANAVRHLEVKIEEASDLPQALRSIVLSGTFDGIETVWTPLGDFFNNVGKIQPFKMWEREVQEDGTFVCSWVMPYENTGVVKLKNLHNDTYKVRLKVSTSDYKWNANSMHFYASWRMDEPTPTFPLFDWNFLEAKGRGVVVGDQWTVLNPREGWWGEGDEKIYIDDDFDRNFPSHFGTGTEDYYGWAGGVVPTPADQFSKPFLGNVIVANPRSMGYNVCSRTRVLDAIPFNERIRFDVESSCGTRQRWHYLQYSQTTFWYGAPGVSHNRQALPDMAAGQLPTLRGLQAKVEVAKKEQYIVDGALEAEILAITGKSEGVKENNANIPVWGEISSGQLKNIWFENKGDFATLKITEQFEASDIKVCAAVGQICGAFDIYVNGERRASQDLYSNHGGMTTPYIDLGKCQPKDNAFVIKFVFKGANAKARSKQKKYALGIDFFLIENNFLNRE